MTRQAPDGGTQPPEGATPVAVVRAIQEAIGRGDLLPLMGRLHRNVTWSVNVARRDAAPWFGLYRGRQGVLRFFEDLSRVEMRRFDVRGVLGDGDLVMVWLQVGWTSPTGRDVDMNEVQIWRFEDDRVISVELLSDTLAAAEAFG